jgi:NTE family protein
MKKIGLALGGGGAKGLAHVPMLEALDENGVRVHRMAGTSIGAVLGALYASGMTGRQIRELVLGAVAVKGRSLRELIARKETPKWIELLDPEFGRHGILRGDKIMGFLYRAMGVSTFEELKIPLRVVATDFWKSRQVVLDAGNLLTAVKASMGLPGVFTPVVRGGRVLIDGGGVNPLPHDLLGDCDVVIAIDVMGRMEPGRDRVPHLLRAVLGTFDIMQNSIIAEKLRRDPPDIYIRPDIAGIDILEFHRAEEVFAQAEPARRKLARALRRLA